MPSFKSCLATLAIMAVTFSPIAAKGHKATEALIGRDLHGANAKAARAVVSNQVGNEKRAAAKAAAAKRALARRAASASASTDSLYGKNSVFGKGAVAQAAAAVKCAKPKYCNSLATVANSHVVCLPSRFCQLQCDDGFAPSGTDCVASAATCSAATCPTVTGGFNTCVNGACSPGCFDSYTLHANADSSAYTCLQLSIDVNNCGTAGNVCAPSYNGVGQPKCYNGACTLSCGKGLYPTETSPGSGKLKNLRKMEVKYASSAFRAASGPKMHPMVGVQDLPKHKSPKLADPSSFLKPAELVVLLVPVHPIKRSKFERYVQLIRKFSKIPLSEVPPDPRGERAVFSSSPGTAGTLLFDYITPTAYAPSHPLAFLSEFQIHRRVHGIIGVVDSTEYTSDSSTLSAALSRFQSSLKDLPRTFLTKLYAFDPSSSQLEQARSMNEGEGLVMIPATGDVQFFLSTILADFASQILWEFSNMAAQLESRTNIPTPQETPGPPSPFSYISHKPNAKSSINTYASPSSPVSPTTREARSINLAPFGIAPPPQSRTANGMWANSNSGNQHGFMYGMSIQSDMAVHPGATPSPPPGAVLIDQKARRRVLGREKKLLADMWLLSGRLEEAIVCYNETILHTKAWQDSVWQASALEGLVVALILQARSPTPPKPPLPSTAASPASPTISTIPDPSTFLSAIPDRLTQAADLYRRMLPPLTEPGPDEETPLDPDRSHPLVYTEACLRGARFLLAVWEAGGSIELAMERLVDVRNAAAEPAKPPRHSSLSPTNTVPRSNIASWLALAYGPHLSLLSLPIRLRLTGEIASIYGRIGYKRKESFVLRELAALCAEGVAGRGIEVFTAEPAPIPPPAIPEEEDDESGDIGSSNGRTSTPPAAPPRISPILLNAAGLSDRGPSIVRTTSDSAGNDSIIRVAEKVCDAFGIVVIPKGPTSLTRGDKRRSVLQGRPVEIQESGEDRFGWPSLQVGVLRDAIGIAEALPDYQAAIRFTVTALRTLADTMLPAEQLRLSQNIPRIFAAATRRGAAFELDYWGPTQLVMSLEVAPLLPNRQTFEHPVQHASTSGNASTVQKNPFIYNPKQGSSTARTRPTAVQNEVLEVFVTLQNPFMFDLEIQKIELSTSGVPFASDPLSTTVPPGSFHTIRLSGTPREAGLLTIRGCMIRLASCSDREFVLPVWSDAEEAKRQKAAILDTSRDRIKSVGLSAFGRSTTPKAHEDTFTYLECNIVPEMPTLWLRSTSLTHGALMLYDGEKSTIRIGLENTSASPVDFIKLTFSDMHSRNAQAYLDENELAAGDAYEIHSETSHRPVFTWTSTGDDAIPPGSSKILEVSCLGKVGCGNGTIQLDYAFVNRPVVKDSGVFHTRQIFCDVFMTVHRALVAHSLEIQRLLSVSEPTPTHTRSASLASLDRRGAALDQRLYESLRNGADGDFCLISVDVMNAYGLPFEVSLEARELSGSDEEASASSTNRQRLEPGATARLLVRLHRFTVSPECLASPIPSLAERQFVVSKIKTSEAEERQTRELFWYREELLKRLTATWNEVGSLRSGTVSLRSLRLTKPMLDIIRGDAVEIVLALEENESADPHAFSARRRPGRRSTYSARANDFLDVTALVSNNTSSTLRLGAHFALRSNGSSLAHLSRYVVIDGLPSATLVALEPGKSESVRFSMCLLAEGRYEFGCTVEEVLDEGAAALLLEQSERVVPRRFGAREPLVIDVSD
ncbi:Trs120-domain-containing protein [Meredithblackwellia eburnea MCA 4105]